MTAPRQHVKATTRFLPVPYGTGFLGLTVPGDKLLACFAPADAPPLEDPSAALRRALREPAEAPPLRELAAGRRSAVVVIDDSTRAVPNALLVDGVLSELEAGGLAANCVTVLVATGLHRPMADEEFRRSLGDWYGRVGTENHNAHATDRLVWLGTTSLGTEIRLNRTFTEADLKILTGDVEVHQLAGYGGGAKSVYPGLVDAESIRRNHSRMHLPGTGPGNLDGNPVRAEIDEVGRMAGIDFLLAVVLNACHQIVSVHAGNWRAAFRSACTDVDRLYRVELPERADLVIASPGGHPRDATLYQAQKALRVAGDAVRAGGTIVLASACQEGSGSEEFERWMEDAYEPEDVVRRFAESFVMGGHKAYQVAREVRRAKVFLYSMVPPGRVRSWFLHPLSDWEDVGNLIENARTVTVLPHAAAMLAEVTAT